jgi:outer membrane protein assembly factor BamB
VGSGKLVALDAETGAVLKEIDLGMVWSGPAIARGRVYVRTGNTLFTRGAYESFYRKQDFGVLHCFGLPEEDEVDRLEDSTKSD